MSFWNIRLELSWQDLNFYIVFKSQKLFVFEAFNGRRGKLRLRYKSLPFMFRIT